MGEVNKVHAVPGRGLEGERYLSETGTFASDRRRDSEVTLMALEDLRAMALAVGVTLSPGDVRRNVVTQGTGRRALVGLEFRLGVCGAPSCDPLSEPCRHLAAAGARILKGLVHRSGLQAQIRTEGVVHVGDVIVIG